MMTNTIKRHTSILATLLLSIALTSCSGDVVFRNNPTDAALDQGLIPDGNTSRLDANTMHDGTASQSDGTIVSQGDGAVPSDGASAGGDGSGGNTDSAVTGDGSAGTTDGSNATDGGGTAADSGPALDTWQATNQPACNGKIYACSDGVDNDGDGLVDAMDPECVGPCDNDEASFATGIPGDNKDCKNQDCFFDGNSGAGGDDCNWSLVCDPLNPGGSLDPACPYVCLSDLTDGGVLSDASTCTLPAKCSTAQSQACIDNCRKYAPNGCDCFGCCQVYVDGVPRTIFLGSGTDCAADPDHIGNCAACTQVASCLNECGECELCMGKTLADLPASCFPPPPDGGIVDGGSVAVPDGGTAGDSGSSGTPDAGTAPDSGPPVCDPSQFPPSICNGGTTCCTHNDCASYQYCDGISHCCRAIITG